MEKNQKQAATMQQIKMHPLYPDKRGFAPSHDVAVGGVILATKEIFYNAQRQVRRITVRNTGDRPIQVGSHFHLFEVNRYLEFDRAVAFGTHLNIPSSTAIRFEPGESREVEIVNFGGKQRIIGFNALVEGYAGVQEHPSYSPSFTRAMRTMRHEGFRSSGEPSMKDKNCKQEKI